MVVVGGGPAVVVTVGWFATALEAVRSPNT
jgi:hypothetical protein